MVSKRQAKENSNVYTNQQAEIENDTHKPEANSSQLLINILVFVIALLLGILVQQHMQPSKQETNQLQTNPTNADLVKLIDELSAKLKNELLTELKSYALSESKKTSQEDSIVNESPKVESVTQASKVVIEHELKTEDSQPEIRITDGKPILLNQDNFKLKPERVHEPEKKPESSKEEKRQRKPKNREERDRMIKENVKKNGGDIEQFPDEVKNFKSTKISQIKPKKMWIPIPNSNGGHRRVPPIEVKHGKEHGSSVKIWLFEEFLSKEECEQLIQVHDAHLKEFAKEKPIVCFDSVKTLKQHLIDLRREKVAELVTPLDLTEGTMCLNQTFSRQLQKWGLKWSFSTAFYPGKIFD
jgi:hypothetical protein